LSILGYDFKAHLLFMQLANKLKPSRETTATVAASSFAEQTSRVGLQSMLLIVDCKI
jgi:hypothetical protein